MHSDFWLAVYVLFLQGAQAGLGPSEPPRCRPDVRGPPHGDQLRRPGLVWHHGPLLRLLWSLCWHRRVKSKPGHAEGAGCQLFKVNLFIDALAKVADLLLVLPCHFCQSMIVDCCIFFSKYIFSFAPAGSAPCQSRSRTKLTPCGRKNGKPSSRSSRDTGMSGRSCFIGMTVESWTKGDIYGLSVSFYLNGLLSSELTPPQHPWTMFYSDCAWNIRNLKVKCEIFGEFKETATSSGGYILDCSVFRSPSSSWACPCATVACAPKPGCLFHFLLRCFIWRRQQLR